MEQSAHSRLLERALAALTVGVLVFDEAGRLVFANETARELARRLHWPALEPGQPAANLPWCLPEGSDSVEGAGLLAPALRGTAAIDLLVPVPQNGGPPAQLRCDALPLRSEAGQIVGAALAFRDVTHWVEAGHESQELASTLREANEQLLLSGLAAQQAAAHEQAARTEAEAALRARDEFLSVAAHELNTPITSLRGYAQSALRQLGREPTSNPAKVRRALQVIDYQSYRLARLVEQLLDLASLQAGQFVLCREEVDLGELVREAVARERAGSRGHSFVLPALPPMPARVDRVRLEHVAANLLDNASQFSPVGTPIEIELSVPSADWARLAVRDHGTGVPPAERQHLFTRYHRAGLRRPAGGLGLGLYLSREIVEAHGGRIEVEFPQDGGTRIIVTLPRNLDGAAKGACPKGDGEVP